MEGTQPAGLAADLRQQAGPPARPLPLRPLESGSSHTKQIVKIGPDVDLQVVAHKFACSLQKHYISRHARTHTMMKRTCMSYYHYGHMFIIPSAPCRSKTIIASSGNSIRCRCDAKRFRMSKPRHTHTEKNKQTCTHKHTRTHTLTRTQTGTNTRTQAHAHTYTHTHTHTHTRTHERKHTHIHTHTHTHTQTRTHTHTHTRAHTYVCARTRSLSLSLSLSLYRVRVLPLWGGYT